MSGESGFLAGALGFNASMPGPQFAGGTGLSASG